MNTTDTTTTDTTTETKESKMSIKERLQQAMENPTIESTVKVAKGAFQSWRKRRWWRGPGLLAAGFPPAERPTSCA